jgi:hypothetical protein
MASILQWHREIVEIVCMFEKELPMIFMDMQIHLLIHLHDEVELVGVFTCHWIFILERYIKKLKGFIDKGKNQRALWKKGYIVYESL